MVAQTGGYHPHRHCWFQNQRQHRHLQPAPCCHCHFRCHFRFRCRCHCHCHCHCHGLLPMELLSAPALALTAHGQRHQAAQTLHTAGPR